MQGTLIRDRDQIVEHLSALIQAQSHLGVKVGEKDQEFLSQALALEEHESGRPSLILDELVPRQGQVRAKHLKTVLCSYKMQGEPYHFKAIIRGVREEPHPMVELAMPSEVVLSQQRRSYRVAPSTSEPVKLLGLDIPEVEGNAKTQASRCVVFDISLGGIAFNTDIPRVQLEPGTQIHRMRIRLPTGNVLEAGGVIRSVRRNDTGLYRNRVGAEFLTLSESARNTLSRYITEKQRHDIRRIKREYE
jgi:c-di-GMP-binding flagellar brake protein YcgR